MITEILLISIPAYISNSIPVLLGGGKPLDFNVKINNKPILGKNKTIRGFLAGVSSGIIIAYLLIPFSSLNTYFYAGMLSSIGAMLGDSIGSFIKRRLDVKEGGSFFLDGTLFIIVSLALAYPFASRVYNVIEVIAVILLTQGLHMFFNKIAYILKWKKVPW